MAKQRIATLTRKDVARRVAETQGVPFYMSARRVSVVIEALRELMIEADPEVRLELRDFGVLEVKKTRAKPKARNPKTSETVFIPARRKAHFKPSKRMKGMLKTPLTSLGYDLPEDRAAAGTRCVTEAPPKG